MSNTFSIPIILITVKTKMKRSLTGLLIFITSLSQLQAQAIDDAFFDRVDSFLKRHVKDDRVAYKSIGKDKEFTKLLNDIETASLLGKDDATRQAFLINAYNLLVLKGVVDAYPLQSVLDINGFFDAKKYTVAGEEMTLNDLEKKELLRTYEDPRFHFVLVCGAIGCPPITPFAYTPERLEEQLEAQTKKALNDPVFIKVNDEEKEVKLSQIFEWYTNDFGGSKLKALQYINRYRIDPIPESYRIGYYSYDWNLNTIASAVDVAPSTGGNGTANNSIRYVVSATIPAGTTETKIFNNLYSQVLENEDGAEDRSTFFTSFITSLYAINYRFMAGIEARYRSVLNSPNPSTPFSVFGGGDSQQFRHGVTTIGPKIRWAPVPKWGNFSIQSAFWIPLGGELEGSSEQPWVDWNNATWWTQVFNDFTLGSNFSLFTEIDFLIEDIGGADDALNRISTPATVILSFFPNPATTLYALNGFSPFWSPDLDYFYQSGLGAKYLFNRNFELEVLYTYFTNSFLQDNNGRASTINFGVRFNR